MTRQLSTRQIVLIYLCVLATISGLLYVVSAQDVHVYQCRPNSSACARTSTGEWVPKQFIPALQKDQQTQGTPRYQQSLPSDLIETLPDIPNEQRLHPYTGKGYAPVGS